MIFVILSSSSRVLPLNVRLLTSSLLVWRWLPWSFLLKLLDAEQANGNYTYDALWGRSVRGSVARVGKYTRPACCHVTYHVHVAELKETAQAPPLPTKTTVSTRTSLVCPIQWARLMACASMLGRLIGLIMRTTLATLRFRPRAPHVTSMSSTRMVGSSLNATTYLEQVALSRVLA